jgi:hypothetical protein
VEPGATSTGACNNTQAETASHVLCEYEDSDQLRPCCLDKHFVEPSDHNKILSCKILYFVGGMGQLQKWKRWECTIYQKMVAVQGSPHLPTALIVILPTKGVFALVQISTAT